MIYIVAILGIYIIIGLILSCVAMFKSEKDEFREAEVKILFQIVIMWAWKYKNLSNKLKLWQRN